MSEGDALMRAILDQPDDDTPRLVYADWLDEQGNAEQKARAEFIRSQVQNGDYTRQCALLAKWGIGWMPRIGRKCAADDEVTTFFSGTRVNQRQTRGSLFATRTFTFNRGFMTQFTNTIAGGMMFDGPVTGRIVRAILSAHPCREFRFEILGMVPLIFVVRRTPKQWRLQHNYSRLWWRRARDRNRFVGRIAEEVAEVITDTALEAAPIPF